MHPSDPSTRPARPRLDIPACIALAWIALFATLYTLMMLRARFPALLIWLAQ